jgi:hypothetical protein
MPVFCQNSASATGGGYHRDFGFLQGSRMKYLTIFAAVLLAACGSSKPPAETATKPKSVPQASGPGAALVNPDFEQFGGDGIPGWLSVQHAGPPSYSMSVDVDGAYAGRGSFHMRRTQPQVYGSLEQTLDARPYAGKTVELSAMLKAQGVGAGGWKLYVNAQMPGAMAYSNGLTGNADWQRDAVQLRIPANALQLTVGVTLLDAGDGWMDNVKLKVVN